MGQTTQREVNRPGHPKRRMANYELLRILAMLMVITLHYLNHTGSLLVPGEAADGRRIAGSLIEAFCIVAVNVYVLISGYFLVEAGFKVKRILILVCQVWFYALLIPVIMLGTGIFGGEGGIYRLVQYVLPLQTEHYWFATSYVLLYLFTPLLNVAVKSMGKRQLQVTVAGLLLLFCGVKSVMPIELVTDRYGYDFGWFLCIYLVAAYIRLYGNGWLATAKRAWMTYVGCAVAIFTIGVVAWGLNEKIGFLAYYSAVPYHYNFVLCLLGAVALFIAFGYVEIPNGRLAEYICRLSPLTFGVYLFHEHIDIRNVWTSWIQDFTGPVTEGGIFGLVWRLMVSVLVVYLAGTFVDLIRLYIFRFAGRYLHKTKPAKWIKRLDDEMSR